MEVLERVKTLKDRYQFDKALDELNTIKPKDRTPKFYRLSAQCFYQNLNISTKNRFRKALKILEEIKNDDNPQETLRLKGAIYKRKYHYSRDIKELYQAIYYYEEASKDINEDKGYGVGNVVYLYLLLLSELGNTISDEIKKSYLNKVQEITKKSLELLEPMDKDVWIYASISSLYLGIEDFENSKIYLKKYQECYNGEFNREQFVTIEQMVKLFDVLPNRHHERELEDILSIYPNAKSMISSVRIGKIGLALSGGGFRASLFHIGVLKRLAELDILRHVQVISTVSGGTILGVYYYLELKKLLEEHENNSLDKKDYIEMVNRIEKNFSKAIESNLRMLAFIKSPRTPLTEKLGQLYQERLYSSIDKNITDMNQLSIEPNIGGKNIKNFLPEFRNFELKNSVPQIIINSTLLNNGHNWQFTTQGMGENEYMTDMTIDDNEIYPFKPYTKDNTITIGSAVASSSAVPILFDPIELKVDDKRVKLADGGLYDNLGLSSLIANECSHIIVSDGSGQIKEESNPSTFRLDVLGRVTEVLMHRTRDGEYKMAKSLKELGVLKGLAIFHMETKSSIDRELQKRLSLIRTDLDAFHELESKGLVYAGYRICSDVFGDLESNREWRAFQLDVVESRDFEQRFNENREEYLKILSLSSKVLFKLFGANSVEKDKRFGLKNLFKIGIDKLFGLFLLPISWGYLRGLNGWYLKRGRLF